jgi:hypothetical protein
VIDPAAQARLEQWKQLLLDLSAENRLLDVREDASCVALPHPDPGDLVRMVAALATGGSIALDGDELARRVSGLRRALRPHADRGVHALWLALGALVWIDADGTARRAPIALYPVDLILRPEAGAPRLVAAEGLRPRGNPVLAEKLERDFGLLLARPAETFDLETHFAEAESIALTRPGWHIESDTRLGLFGEIELASWDELVLESPIIRHLATATTSFQQPSAAAADAITRRSIASRLEAPPDLLAPLDADASQLAAIAAAGAGASFVLQGAPGTGKSQTIANLIVHCMGLGKSVLFVSPKIAALEVVQQRLAAIGLGDLCLEVFGAKANAGLVLAQLGRVLERAFRPGGKSNISAADDRLAELRATLDGHVAGLHRVGPFGRSLHEVLGRLVELRSTARAALAESDATGLDAATFERRHIAIAALAAAAVPVEPVGAHPWRASSLDHFDGTGTPLAAIDEAAGAGAALAAAVREVATLVPGLVARTRDQLQALGALAALAAASPRPGAELLTHLRGSRGDEIGEQIALLRARGTGSIDTPRDPLSFLLLAKRHRALAAEVRDRFTEAVDNLDAHAAWQQLRKWTTRPLRFVALRSVRADLRRIGVPMELETDEAMVTALEAVIAERACRAALASAAEPARRWFGDLAGDLDLDKLDAAVGWAADLRKAFDAIAVIGGESGRATAWRALVAQVAASPNDATQSTEAASAFGRLAESVARWIPALARLAAATGIDRATLASGDDHLAALRERLETLRHAIDSLGAWVAFHIARRNALAAGAGPVVEALERDNLGAAELALAWERATLLAWAEAELGDSALGQFHGAAHHAHVAAFADLDRASLALVRSRALVRFAERVPAANIPAPRDTGRNAAADPEIDLLRAALKRDPAMPIRALFASIPTLLPKLAPCLVATPQAVAEHLDTAMKFDLVVFDEASQLGIAHALGALARADAAVIVGDSQQLPPREAMPSILDIALAARLPQLRLASHYRSRHEDLFAFANERFYGNRIHLLPAAHGGSDLGISLRHVESNLAEAVVAEVIARTIDPAQRSRSIAVVTASRAMQDDIEDLLEHARALDPTLSHARSYPGATIPPLVREVDAIQGDERDVVLLVLDPEAPLDDRRLVVATTRAREQLIIFSPQLPDATTGALAELLSFAQGSGRAGDTTAPASPIIDALARALADRGWAVRHGVGCGPYRIDLAIVDPNDPERYVMAIEHDGLAYANALSARDRDRLRPQILQHLGWRLHRLWSLDWWTDPDREIQRAHAAIVTALAASRQRRVSIPPRADEATREPATRPRRATPVLQIPPVISASATPGEGVPVSSSSASSGALTATSAAATLPNLAAGSAPIRIARNTIPIGPYMAAAIPSGRRTPDDLFATRHLAELGKVIEQVLAAEAPMHVDLLARRVGAYFGVGRVTQRVKDQVCLALAGRGRFGDEQDVVWRLDQDPAAVPAVRVAGSGPTAKREVIEIPLSELASAARIVVERASNIAAPDLIRDAARLLGFARITEDVTSRVELGVRLAEVRELIRIDNGKASVPAD